LSTCTTGCLPRKELHGVKLLNALILGPERDEETGEWIKLHNEELHDLYSSPSIIRIIKERMMRWAGHVAQMEEELV
jgi:hypothetical protein